MHVEQLEEEVCVEHILQRASNEVATGQQNSCWWTQDYLIVVAPSRRHSHGVRYYADRGLQTIAAAIAIDFPTRITNRYRFAGIWKNQRILPQI